jgi:hypothetical protein
MRPWRDVMSEQEWQDHVVDRADKSGAKVGKVARLKGLFDGRSNSPEAFLTRIGGELGRYHAIEKASLKQLKKRQEALRGLSKLAQEYLKTFQVDEATAALRDTSKHAYSGAHMTGSPARASVDRNVLTIARRSLRKAAYLEQLRHYYQKGGTGFAFRSAPALLGFVGKAQEVTANEIGLNPGTRMEELDFAHRGDYETHDPGVIATGTAFLQWSQDANAQNTPFFLWLENHALCLHQNKEDLETRSVAYLRADSHQGASVRAKLRVVIPGAPLQMIDMASPSATPMVASTTGYQAEGGKEVRTGHHWGEDMAAFVWSREGELFLAHHRAQEFHHSSFVSGQRVRCAGMIIIENGWVTGLSNNSGHYKPRKQHLLAFVNYLASLNALKGYAAMKVHTGAPQAWQGTASQFVANYNTI